MICFKNKVFYDGCELKVDDFTKYPCGTGAVEFVAYVKDDVSTISNKSIRISTNPNCSYTYKPEIDGRYVYYKIALPVFDSFDSEDNNTVDIPKGYFISVIGCKKIICFNENNSVSLSDNSDELSVKEISDLKELIQNEFIQDVYTEEFFSICNLNTCVARLQKRYLLEHSDDCGTRRCVKGSDSDKANRDFLFIASYLIDYYIGLRDFAQAEDLLNTIQMCNNSICGKNANSNCGCTK